MKILTTGSTGYIGTSVAESLASNGYEVIRASHALSTSRQAGTEYFPLHDSQTLISTLDDMTPEIVIHCGWSTIHETSQLNYSKDISENLIGTVNLLGACRTAGVRRIIFLSSGGTVYGETRDLPIREDAPKNPVCSYGITKLAAEKYLALEHINSGLEILILRPSVVYGPGSTGHPRKGLINQIINAAYGNRKLTVWGDGSVSRDFLYKSDLVQAVLAAVKVKQVGLEILNVGGDASYSINEVIEIAAEVLDCRFQIEYQPGRPFDVENVDLDNSAITAKLGWLPSIGLREGIDQTASWLRSTQNTASN